MIIYQLTNLLNGKSYIGQTTETPHKRFNRHCKSPYALGKAIRKYGRERFECKVLVIANDKAEANYYETGLIEKFNTFGSDGYNLTTGGEGTPGLHIGRKLSPAHIEAIRQANLGNTNMRGRKWSEEQKQRRRGQPLSEEHKEQLRRFNLGRTRPPETREKVRQAKLGKKRAPFSQEWKEKIARAGIGRVWSDASREKLRQVALKRWAKRKALGTT
jgi:group I intron endonuclease